MEVIVLAGVVENDCEKKVDKKGSPYVRFTLMCDGMDFDGKPTTSFYRCYCWLSQFFDLKAGEIVYLTGTQKITIHNGKINIDVFVKTISNGKKI